MGKERKNLCCFCLGLLLILVVFYFPWLANQQSFYLCDITYYFEPFCRFLGAALREARLPLWNPLCYTGMPQMAIPSPGALYPLNWLFACLPFNPALATILLCQQWIAGVGSYLLISSLGWGPLAAVTAGIITALSGYMFSLQSNFTLSGTAAWLPFCLWALRRVGPGFERNNLLTIALAALGGFLLISAGRPEIGLPAGMILCGYIAFSAYYSYKLDRIGPGNFRTACWRTLALLIGALLAMPVILPTLEWIPLSPRAHGLRPADVFLWSANWYDLLSMVMPQPLGDQNLAGARFLPLVAMRPGFMPYLSSAFVGPVSLTLAIWGACDRTWRARPLVFMFLIASMIVTLGNQLPVFPALVNWCPWLAIFRYPIKLIVLPLWCITLFAARGAYLSLIGKPDRFGEIAAWSVWAIMLTVSAVFQFSPGLAWIAPRLGLIPPAHVDLALVSQAQVLVGQSGLRVAAIGLACSLAGRLLWQQKLGHTTFSCLITAGLLASLLACAWTYCRHGAPPGFLDQEPFLARQIATLPAGSASSDRSCPRILPLYFDPLANPPWNRGQTAELSTQRLFQYGRDLLLPNTNLDAGLPSAFGYEAAEVADYRKIYMTAWRKSAIGSALPSTGDSVRAERNDLPLSVFCRMTATGYVFTQAYKAGPGAGDVPLLDPKLFEPVVEDRRLNLRIYQVLDALPRAYLAGSWSWCDSHADAVDRVLGSQASKFDPRAQTIIEHRSAYTAPGDPQPGSEAEVLLRSSWLKLMQDRPEHLSLSVKADAPCFLVLADQYYPGWQVKVDNILADLYRANAVQRAVFLNPGPHLVEFNYEPESFDSGLRLAGLGAVILLTLLAAATYLWCVQLVKS